MVKTLKRTSKRRNTQRQKIKHRRQKKITKRTIHNGGAPQAKPNRSLVVTTINIDSKQQNREEIQDAFMCEISKVGGLFNRFKSNYILKIVINIGKYKHDTHELMEALVREVFDFTGVFPIDIKKYLLDYDKLMRAVDEVIQTRYRKGYNNDSNQDNPECWEAKQNLINDSGFPRSYCNIELGFKFDKNGIVVHSIEYTGIYQGKTECSEGRGYNYELIPTPEYSTFENKELNININTTLTEDGLKERVKTPNTKPFNVVLFGEYVINEKTHKVDKIIYQAKFYGWDDNLTERDDVKSYLTELDEKDKQKKEQEEQQKKAAQEAYDKMTDEEKAAAAQRELEREYWSESGRD